MWFSGNVGSPAAASSLRRRAARVEAIEVDGVIDGGDRHTCADAVAASAATECETATPRTPSADRRSRPHQCAVGKVVVEMPDDGHAARRGPRAEDMGLHTVGLDEVRRAARSVRRSWAR